jgi:hypothetical protein
MSAGSQQPLLLLLLLLRILAVSVPNYTYAAWPAAFTA